MQIPHGTVIALVDGEKFRLFRNSGNEAKPQLADMATPDLEGHNKSSGAHHHSSSANPQGSLLEEDAHAAAVAEWLNGQVLGHKIDLLVVVAPPRTLGELRKHYHRMTQEALVCEIPKEMLGRDGLELLDALKDL